MKPACFRGLSMYILYSYIEILGTPTPIVAYTAFILAFWDNSGSFLRICWVNCHTEVRIFMKLR